VGSESASALGIEQVFELIENDEARCVRSICCIERIESGISLVLWRQTGQVGRGFPYCGKDVGGQLEEGSIFINPEQDRCAPKGSLARTSLLFGIVEDE
jgi:hypothetical protein